MISVSPDDIQEEILITKLVINARDTIHFSWMRCTALFVMLSLLYFGKKYKLHTIRVTEEDRAQSGRVEYIVLGLALFYTIALFVITSPQMSQTVKIQYTGENSVWLTPPDHRLLTELPGSDEELKFRDIYTVLFCSLLHGHPDIPLPVDPRLGSLANPYDASLRKSEKVSQYWDYALYKGKYYVYFGLAPLLTVYAPCFLLTGKLPSLSLASFLLALFAVCGFFAAMQSVKRVLLRRYNLLLCLLAELALLSASGIWYLQVSMQHYQFVNLSCILFLSLTVFFSWTLLLTKKRNVRCLLFLATAISCVFCVLSRPHILLLALIFMSYPMIRLYRESFGKSSKDYIPEILCFCLPLFLGAVFVFWYNPNFLGFL